jgi:hypothetical protein
MMMGGKMRHAGIEVSGVLFSASTEGLDEDDHRRFVTAAKDVLGLLDGRDVQGVSDDVLRVVCWIAASNATRTLIDKTRVRAKIKEVMHES